MILPTYPGKVPQTSPFYKDRNSERETVGEISAVIFQGYVGEILDPWIPETLDCYAPHPVGMIQ